MKKLYIAATQQHDGKTTLAIGLFMAAQKRGLKACFIKPVGQRYLMEEGSKVDEDAVLFKKALRAKGNITSLSPITIPRGFTKKYIFNRDPETILNPIKDSFNKISQGQDIAIIEGTGHAGVGSVLDASNAAVANLLGADCIIAARGGVGRCIDEIALNRALFEQKDVKCLGAVINKVYEEKYDEMLPILRQGLANIDIPCLGIMPYRDALTYPTVQLVKEELELDALTGEDRMDRRVKHTIVAAMEPQNMVGYIKDGSLVVVPGDRVDNIVTSINAHLMRKDNSDSKIAGLLLTGGLIPHLSIVNLLCQVDVPVLLSKEDTATTAYRVKELVAKIGPDDRSKLEVTRKLVEDYVEVDKLLSD